MLIWSGDDFYIRSFYNRYRNHTISVGGNSKTLERKVNYVVKVNTTNGTFNLVPVKNAYNFCFVFGTTKAYFRHAVKETTTIIVRNLNDLSLDTELKFDRKFTRFFATADKYYLAEGNFVYRYDHSKNYEATFRFDRPVFGFDGTSFYSYDEVNVFKIPLNDDLNEYVEPDDTATAENNFESRKLERDEKLNKIDAKKVLAALAYRMFVAFPYDKVEPSDGDPTLDGDFVKVDKFYPVKSDGDLKTEKDYESSDFLKVPRIRCKFYSLGFDRNGPLSERKNDLGGQDLVGESQKIYGFDRTKNFVVSDWEDGYPNKAGRLSGKDFFITSKSKLSFSDIDKNQFFGKPIKVLLNSSGYNLRISVSTDVNTPSTQYRDILKSDFTEQTQALADFFALIDEGIEQVPFKIGDPFTYSIFDSQGIRPNIFHFFLSDIGAFSASGAQIIFFTDRGVFYGGLQADSTSPSNFLNLAKVSRFLSSKKYHAVAEVLNRVYVQDDRGDFYVVNYDLNNRNFTTIPCAFDSNIRKCTSLVNFIGDSVLGVGDSGRIFCSYSNPKGDLMGESEFKLAQHKFLRVDSFRDKFFVVAKEDTDLNGKIRFFEYDEEDKMDKIDGPSSFVIGDIETAPIFIGRTFPSHSLMADKVMLRVFVFSRNLMSFSLFNPVSNTFDPVNLWKNGVPSRLVEVSQFFQNKKIDIGRGLQIRLNGKYGGVLSGLSFYYDSQEL